MYPERNYNQLVKLAYPSIAHEIVIMDNSDGRGPQVVKSPKAFNLTIEDLDMVYPIFEDEIKEHEKQIQIETRFTDAVLAGYVAYKQAGGTADKQGFLDLMDSMRE